MSLDLPGHKSPIREADGESKVERGGLGGTENVVGVFPLWEVIFPKNYTEGFTLDTAIAPDFITLIASILDPKFSVIGLKAEVGIYNRSGANDDYSWELTNVTKATTLASKSGHTINQKVYDTWVYIFGLDKFTVGDSIKFNVSEGVVGTAAGQASNGQIKMKLSYIVESLPLAEWLGAQEL